MDSLDRYAREKLDALEARSLRRHMTETDRHAPGRARRASQALVNFCDNDYLGLGHHPEVVAAAADALRRFGTGAGASRLVTGNHPLLVALERDLADLKQTEDCVVFGSGYLANVGIVPSLVGQGDAIFIDELAHSCLFAGTRLSGANVFPFRHNDTAHLEDLLATQRGAAHRVLIITDTVFSMDGDLAPLPTLARLADRHDAWLMTDDAHGIGVLGGGRGGTFAFAELVDVPLQMGTLSKAIGSYGGYLCASRAVCELIRNRARTFVYSTGLPPPSAAAALAALRIIRADPALAARPVALAERFTRRLGIPVAQSPIVPIIVGDAADALHASRALQDQGFLVTAIRPPTVPQGTARLRVTFCAGHWENEVDALAGAIEELAIGAR
jgi:8-amino-7-oxononanoate synthase